MWSSAPLCSPPGQNVDALSQEVFKARLDGWHDLVPDLMVSIPASGRRLEMNDL